MDEDSLVYSMVYALKHSDLPSALSSLRSYIAGIPYDIITKKEWNDRKKRESFYKLLMYIVFSLINSKVDCEHRGILGRFDVVIKTAKDVFVIELKVDGTVEEALNQIEDKGYAIRWSADGRRVIKCGAVIDSSKCNLTRWRVVDEAGNVMCEQDFRKAPNRGRKCLKSENAT